MAIVGQSVQKILMRFWDSKEKVLKKYAPWTLASQVDFDNGLSIQDVLGDFKGLTTSTNVEEEGYVIDASVINNIVVNDLGCCRLFYDDNYKFYIQLGDDISTRKEICSTSDLKRTFNILRLRLNGYASSNQPEILFDGQKWVTMTFHNVTFYSPSCTFIIMLRFGGSELELFRYTTTSRCSTSYPETQSINQTAMMDGNPMYMYVTCTRTSSWICEFDEIEFD